MDSKFINALSAHNIPLPRGDFRDGEFLRWGKKKRYWATKIPNGYSFGDFISDFSATVFNDSKQKYAGSNRNTYEIPAKNYEPIQAEYPSKIYKQARPLTKHQYCVKKQIKVVSGLKCSEDKIIVPIYDGDEIISLQFIDSLGFKKYMKGCKKSGGYFTIGDYTDNVLITEGLATGCSLYESTGFMTVVAFDAGNLSIVAAKMKDKYPDAKIIICADNDQYSNFNIGVKKATNAAIKHGCYVAIPEFTDISTKPTDFNDLMILEGKERVKEMVTNATNVKTPVAADLSYDKGDGLDNISSDKFELGENDLFYVDKYSKKQRISNYIKVIAVAIDENDEWGSLIELKDIHGKLRQIFIPDTKFSGNCEAIRRELAALGLRLECSQKARHLLNKYLTNSRPSKRIVCVSKPGWHFDKIFATADKIIGKFDSEVVCTVDQSPFKKKGSLESWQENVASYCINNSRLILSVCTAFAVPALSIYGLPSGGFHFVGRSSVGKTTCLKVAASVCGDKNYIKSWRATDNGLEGLAVRHNDSLLILDEIGQVDPNKLGDIAYMLANGIGKARANSFGKASNAQTWRTLFLSSGETSLSDHMNTINKKSHTGQDIRLLSVTASPNGETHGIFEDLHGFEDGAELSNYLIEKTEKCYGTALSKFLEVLVKNREYIAEYVCQKIKEIKNVYLPSPADGQDIRIFERFAFVGVIGEYATQKGITGWAEGEAIRGCMKCFSDWLEEKGGFGNIEEMKVLESIKLFFEQHGDSRFLSIPAGLQRVSNMVGYRDDTHYYVTPESFKNVVCKGFDRKFVIQVLKNKGWLVPGANGEAGSVKCINYISVRVYKFSRAAIYS